jgi:hypothetical protein
MVIIVGCCYIIQAFGDKKSGVASSVESLAQLIVSALADTLTTEKCQFITEKCQFRTEKCHIACRSSSALA